MKAKKGIPVTKYKSQIILMKKNGLNVEHFRYHITINYDKSSSACIDLSNVSKKKKKKNLLPNDVLVRPTEKVGRMTLEP